MLRKNYLKHPTLFVKYHRILELSEKTRGRIKMENKLKDVVALVTGGASGIGKSVVETIVSNGGKVIIADINPQGQDLAEEFGKNAVFVKTDVVSETSVDEALKVAKEKFGKVNVVVNSAGIFGGGGSIYDFVNDKPHSLDDCRRFLEINTIGTLNVMTRSIGIMKENEPDEDGQRGVIINLASIAGFGNSPSNIAYSASKAAVMAMTTAAALHVGKVGIRVVAIAPGLTDTPLAKPIPAEDREIYLKDTTFPNRLGRSTEIAHLIKSIIENTFINCEVIRIDAGIRR